MPLTVPTRRHCTAAKESRGKAVTIRAAQQTKSRARKESGKDMKKLAKMKQQ
ncbi:hypothetical protein [Methylosinus sp. PW1]|uniref:hypothetical protein n=1 Tax=Methylosinus sp. PW1 TaxID=107636 RepID=UPI000B06C3B3|nr:hypothetical protein [Methylosinus sp. PW1]